MYPLANSTLRSDAKPPTPGCCCNSPCKKNHPPATPPCRARRTGIPCPVTQRQSRRRSSGARRVSVAPRAMNRTYSVETANQNPRPNNRPSVVAVPIPRASEPPPSPIRAPSPAPDMMQLITRAVEHRMDTQERAERVTVERSLAEMQQYRREFVMCVLRDNPVRVMANLTEMLQLNHDSPIMRSFQPPRNLGFDYPDVYDPIDSQTLNDDTVPSFNNLNSCDYSEPSQYADNESSSMQLLNLENLTDSYENSEYMDFMLGAMDRTTSSRKS